MTREWALFLDFDGTLVDIAPRPDAIVVPAGLVHVLARLRARLGGALALISGRAIATLDKAFAPERFDAAGLHGLELRSGGRCHPCDALARPELRPAARRLEAGIGRRPGIVIEDKGCSLAVHWRLAPGDAAAALRAADEVLTQLGAGYRLQLGRMVAEIVPAKSDKGQAIAIFLQQQPYAGRRALFIGDDVTDEHGFEVVNALGGVSVRIGNGATRARLAIPSPSRLRKALAAWADTGDIDPEAEFAS